MKKLIAALLVSAAPLTAFADWEAGMGYSRVESDIDIAKPMFTTWDLSAGYEFSSDSVYRSAIVVDYGFGISGDEVYGVGIDLDRYAALSYKGEYDFSDKLYGLFSVGYAEAHGTVSGAGEEISDSDSDMMYGIGIGYKTGDVGAFELKYRDTGSDLELQLLSLGYVISL